MNWNPVLNKFIELTSSKIVCLSDMLDIAMFMMEK